MSRIVLAGAYLWAWGLWHSLWAAGLLWLWVNPVIAPWWFATLYTVFLPLEVSGAIVNERLRDGRARTLSEVRQYFPVTFGKGPNGIGWKAFGYSGLVDAVVVGWLIYPISPLAGAVVASLLALWLVPHFGWRERVG